MSRIGKKVITIPEKTTVEVVDGKVTVKGPLGVLSTTLHSDVSVAQSPEGLTVSISHVDPQTAALWGTFAAHILNMIEGVNKGFSKKLIVEGIGYKADVKGADLVMALGFSHPVVMKIPDGLKVTTEKGTITITGIDKEVLGQFAAGIRDWKKPEPYKGKGIRYDGEYVRRKQGKKSV